MKADRVSFYIGFVNVIMSSSILGLGTGKWAYNQFENIKTLGAAVFFSIFCILLVFASKEHRLVLKEDKLYKKKFIIFFILNFSVTSFIASLFYEYILFSFVFSIFCGLLLTKNFIDSYERLTGEKVE
ncbi:hypothetical protein LIA75_001856 [Vibrio fluvialis]|nr:hypothetical protein [Vibrio fluvialis]